MRIGNKLLPQKLYRRIVFVEQRGEIPNHTMEQLVLAVKMLREEYKFRGYIHLKAIPGADYGLIDYASAYADRMSLNIELPTERSLKLLAP